ncbi:MAG: helix-turn-helix domain-containing protein [Bacillota bacterium]
MEKAWFWDYRAVFSSNLSASAKLVRLYLASRADGEQPSVSEIAEGCGINEGAVMRALSELESEGWIGRGKGSGVCVLCGPPGSGYEKSAAGTSPDADRRNPGRYPYKFCGHDEEHRRRRKEFLKSLC